MPPAASQAQRLQAAKLALQAAQKFFAADAAPPTDAWFLYGQALVQAHSGEAGSLAAAQGSLQAALKCEPRLLRARCLLASLLLRQGDIAGARQLVQALLSVAPTYAKATRLHGQLTAIILAPARVATPRPAVAPSRRSPNAAARHRHPPRAHSKHRPAPRR